MIDPVGGSVRTASIDLLGPGGRLLLAGNASGDWNHQIDSNRIWRGNLAVLGFSTGSFLPGHKDLAREPNRDQTVHHGALDPASSPACSASRTA